MSDDAIRVSGPINAAGLEMTLETGKLAQLADGAVVTKVGGTTVLSTVTTSKPREGIDFFPLTVDAEDRGDDLHLVAEIVGERRAQRTVGETRGEDRVL